MIYLLSEMDFKILLIDKMNPWQARNNDNKSLISKRFQIVKLNYIYLKGMSMHIEKRYLISE